MICSIHQPHFFPWLGYFNKVLNSDVFVWLHSVQYRKNYFQNRTRIKDNRDQLHWLTLPVHVHLGMEIDSVSLADANWRGRIEKTIDQFYRKAPFFSACWPVLLDALEVASNKLEDVNYQTFMSVLKLMQVTHVRVVKIGELLVEQDDPTLRLVEVCKQLGATHYIAGKGGKDYMQLDAFRSAEVQVIWQEFDPGKIVYPQRGQNFLPGLSVIDSLFNVGPEITRKLIESAWIPFIKNGS